MWGAQPRPQSGVFAAVGQGSMRHTHTPRRTSTGILCTHTPQKRLQTQPDNNCKPGWGSGIGARRGGAARTVARHRQAPPHTPTPRHAPRTMSSARYMSKDPCTNAIKSSYCCSDGCCNGHAHTQHQAQTGTLRQHMATGWKVRLAEQGLASWAAVACRPLKRSTAYARTSARIGLVGTPHDRSQAPSPTSGEGERAGCNH